MSTALFALSNVLPPLQNLWRWLSPKSVAMPGPSPVERPVREVVPSSRTHKPLRIVRILEADQAPTQVGRMIISGRMADVCAELDRLAALH